MENLIGQELYQSIAHLETEKITELRIRKGFPLQMEMGGKVSNVLSSLGKEIIIESGDIKEIVLNFSNGSFFSKEHQAKEGFLTKNGARLGICGECDYITGEILSIADITSLALRLPYNGEISPCVHSKHISQSMQSTLIISPYGVGKTTFLKKILMGFSREKKVFLCDERGEFSEIAKVLSNTDCMQNCKKNKSFEIAIRLFSPNAIMIDEMFYDLDSHLLKKARMAGIAIFASFHGRNLQDFINSEIYKGDMFQKYVVLSEKFGKGTVEKVYDENFCEVKIYKSKEDIGE